MTMMNQVSKKMVLRSICDEDVQSVWKSLNTTSHQYSYGGIGTVTKKFIIEIRYLLAGSNGLNAISRLRHNMCDYVRLIPYEKKGTPDECCTRHDICAACM